MSAQYATQQGVHLGWFGIFRLGLVQTALGAIVVLTTSTLNRVMVVELMLPAMLPGILVGLHYAVQLSRPRWGYGSDMGGRRTPWIIGGMAVLALGGVGAALSVALMATNTGLGIAAAVLAFVAIGVGVGASGTSLLTLLAVRVVPERRAPAATIVWVMMIVGFILTAGIAGGQLDPFSIQRLVVVTSVVCAIAFALTLVAVVGIEGRSVTRFAQPDDAPKPSFSTVMAEVWNERKARNFSIFVFVSMLAYSTQDLILEPFAGAVFDYTPGASTQLAGVQHGGVLVGMVLVALAGLGIKGRRLGSLQSWTVGGCFASGLALFALAFAGRFPEVWPLKANVFALGLANGAFAVAAIGSMMSLASEGGKNREGVRMGLWGAAQAIAFGLGGLMGTIGLDVTRWLTGSVTTSYSVVFTFEGLLFLASALLAARIGMSHLREKRNRLAVAAVMAICLVLEVHEMNEQSEATSTDVFDAIVVGGGPAGATAATQLAREGWKVLMMDKDGRIKPCGGAIPPRCVEDFAIPDSLLVARISSALMVAPSGRQVPMPIENGYVGMVDREHFDEWLRARAVANGVTRVYGTFDHFTSRDDGTVSVHYTPKGADADAPMQVVRAKVLIGADGARSAVAKQAVKGADRVPCVFAYHEIVRSPDVGSADNDDAQADFDPERCDVYYQGRVSPDFYGWVFPAWAAHQHWRWKRQQGFSLRGATKTLRETAGLETAETVRREGAPIPLKPLKKWDDGRNVLVVGDAAGIVAPASGEGIYYAMEGGRMAADAVGVFLKTGDAKALAGARKAFIKAHGRVFWILGMMQHFWYSSDKRRERFVSICDDADVQRLTWQAYMNKKLVRSDPLAHMRIFFKDIAHLFGLVPAAPKGVGEDGRAQS